ncbi:MAG: hypothetical protein Q9218_003126 [Villophora microphyllina]
MAVPERAAARRMIALNFMKRDLPSPDDVNDCDLASFETEHGIQLPCGSSRMSDLRWREDVRGALLG